MLVPALDGHIPSLKKGENARMLFNFAFGVQDAQTMRIWVGFSFSFVAFVCFVGFPSSPGPGPGKTNARATRFA